MVMSSNASKRRRSKSASSSRSSAALHQPTALQPDTEENVAAETDCVFRNFVYQMYVNDVTTRPEDDLPSLPEVKILNHQPVTPLAEIGRQLAAVGDDINDKYRPQFNRMITSLNVTPETAYGLFAEVARKLFDDGVINWGRIVTLLCFGYRMAMTVIRAGLSSFFSSVVRYIVRFILVERIAKWIANQGGWRSVMSHIPESVGWSTIGFILTLSALSVITVICLTRKP